jgi:hypothetical protein
LWKVKSKEYMDRVKRNDAYEMLIKKWRRVDHTANREKNEPFNFLLHDEHYMAGIYEILKRLKQKSKC